MFYFYFYFYLQYKININQCAWFMCDISGCRCGNFRNGGFCGRGGYCGTEWCWWVLWLGYYSSHLWSLRSNLEQEAGTNSFHGFQKVERSQEILSKRQEILW